MFVVELCNFSGMCFLLRPLTQKRQEEKRENVVPKDKKSHKVGGGGIKVGVTVLREKCIIHLNETS